MAASAFVIVGVGIYHVRKGATKKFLRDLEEHPGHWATCAGGAEGIAKGIALGVVGGLFIAAACRAAPASRRAWTRCGP